ncbi:CPX chromosomal region candidate gene 1 protein [Hippopotamus amphibius kiboko]|uniref:CPX chromosomal region candidate gene 1 protein n=1 Tax=Hippopotamus amphibius kiboko TaxID=575201 RepID=UPI0025940937|nr:CPX chromosomal region candidate gene 1 protein [Hippopotamus amphibius kiboko]
MTSPTKEGSNPADNDLKNLENETPNDSSTDVEPSFADSNMISQVRSSPMNRELDAPTSQEHAVPQAAENDELEVEETQKDSQKEDLKENESFIIQVPIARKWVFLIPLINRARFYSGRVEIRTSDFCHNTINYKISLQLSISWRIPFINNHEMRIMIRSLLCGRHFSQATGHQNTMWVKQKYVTFLLHPNVLAQGERTIIFGRALRVYYYHPLIERLTSGKFYKSTDTKGKDGFHVFVRPVFYIPQAQIQNTFNQKAFEDRLRSHHNMRVVIISTKSGWKYLCPNCRSSFNNLVEFRQHSCIFPPN